MYKCKKCEVTLSGDCIVVWKCPECGKAVKLNLAKLNKVQEMKKQNVGKHLLKCSSCGYPLDDGNEKIICKCLSCGNVIGGNLEYFAGGENSDNNDIKIDTDNSYSNMIECPECRKKVLSDSKLCSYCGYPLKRKKRVINEARGNKRKSSITPQYLKKIIVCIFIIFAGIIILSNIIIRPKMGSDFQRASNFDEEIDSQLKKADVTNSVKDDKDEKVSVDHEERKNTIPKSVDHYCEADGCLKEGIKTIIGFNGTTEYYCSSHYQEIQDILNMMEEDVGSGAYSKHQCEECSKEGTHEIIGFSGITEYYCTEHYNKIVETINMMTESQSVSTTAFTNKTGTSTTKCAHSGCNNFIASSGDTYYCTMHSKKCGVCGCYIDEDALFCPTCIIDAFTQ